MNKSWLRVLATSNKSLGTKNRAPTNTKNKTSTIFHAKSKSDNAMLSLEPASMGVINIMGTTSKSWKMSMARAMRPWGVCISPLSPNTFKTIAVLLSENKNPMKMDFSQLYEKK